jgi:AraC family transcriptional regulator
VTLPRDILRLLAAVNARRDDVSLTTMAAIAHRSPYDLHRRFRRDVGETPKSYTSRVRLARAAADLLRTDRTVAAIATAHGYSGHEVFTRAFTRAFGLAPRAYRARGLHTGTTLATTVHAATVVAVAPCVGLYRTTTTPEEGSTVPADITVTDVPAIHALVARRRVGREEIATAIGEILPGLFGFATAHGLAMSGPPFTRYPEFGMGTLVVEAGVPLAAPATGELPPGVEALTIPAGPAAVTVHHGHYERLPETYRELETWLEREGRKAAGPPRETYLTDPGEYPDPETWRTEIAQPVL